MTDRPKMHTWGLDGYKKIYADEFPKYAQMGYRDHPKKVGLPLESPVTAPEVQKDTEARGEQKQSVNASVEGKANGKRAYNRRAK